MLSACVPSTVPEGVVLSQEVAWSAAAEGDGRWGGVMAGFSYPPWFSHVVVLSVEEGRNYSGLHC